jgi:basic membrane protein A
LKKIILVFKWAGVFSIVVLFLLPTINQNVKAAGGSSPSFQSSLTASAQEVLLTEEDLPGFRQARESEAVGYLALAKRLTSGLTSPQTEIANVSTFRINNVFQSEYVVSFLAYPISENDGLVFNALADNPQSILETLVGIAQTSGNTEEPRLLSEMGGISEKSMGFSMTLGQEPVAQNIDFIWVRRGNIIQSIWVIYPIGGTPSINLHQLGILVNQRVAERFPGTTFRPAGLLVPEITTNIPTPLDISTRPAVIGTNLLLAALMMLPFALAAEIFTRLSAEREELLRDKFWLTRWLLILQRRVKSFLGTRLKQRGANVNIPRLLVIILFYGLAFSLLDRSWNPFSVTGLVLFLNMTVAYGVVGIADDIVQWRILRKWGKPAEINLRPTNIFIAAVSTITSRLLSLVPGLMFGTPEALVIDEARLGTKRRNYLLKISAYTLLAIGLGLWALTTITAFALRQNISDTLGNVIGGLEGFLLIVFAVALENTFVQMLGLPGSFGEAIRKRSRWLWLLGLMCITFAFYHTLINPRGDLAAALQESNVWIFLGAAGAFVVLAFGLWAYLRVKGGKPAGMHPSTKKRSRKVKSEKIIPAWVWLAIGIIGLAVIGDILITRHDQEVIQASNSPTPSLSETTLPADPTPAAETRNEVEMSFIAPSAIGKLCYLPMMDVTENPEDIYTWRSIQLTAAQYGAQAKYINPETPDDAGYTQAMDQLIQDDCDLIVGNWFAQAQVFQTAVSGSPGQDFMYFGWETDLPNLWSTEYSLPEGAYLAGYLAAAASRSGNVGIFGGYQYPVVVASMDCFAQGVREYNAAHQREVAVLGWNMDTQQGLFADDFLSPDQGALLTNDLFSQGADVIFPVAGHALESTGYGAIVFTRQHEGVYIIGVDLDWAWAMPDSVNRIITSVEARYEQSIALAVDALANGEFHGGSHMATLATGEVALSPLRGFSELVSPDLNAELAGLANSASINSHQTNQNINGFLNLDSVGGENWPSNIWLTIHIFAAPGGPLLFTGESLTDQSGGFYQDLGVDLKPGVVVEVNDCLDTRSVTLVPFTIDVIDPDSDTVSGTAPSGVRIFVVVSKEAYLWVTAGSNGLWQASFAGKFDITNQTTAQAIAQDANGNGTAIKTGPK